MRYSYDLHVHSCLSPCADNDNTPNNIAGMAHLSGIKIVALTDHNSAKNCPAFFEAAKRYGIVPVAGMELTTSEDIHVVCLFEELENAMRFDEFIAAKRVLIKNRTDIFGDQLILDGNDEMIGTEEHLLPKDPHESRVITILSEGARAALAYSIYSPIERIFAFNLTDDEMRLFSRAAEEYLLNQLGHGFKTLDFYKDVAR